MKASILAVFAALCTAQAACAQTQEIEESSIFPDPQVARMASAACAEDVAVVRSLINEGVSPNLAGDQGITPLIWALRCESIVGVRELLAGGADPDQPAGGYLLPLSVAATIENTRFVEALLDAGADINGLSHHVDASPLLRAQSLGIHTDFWDNFYLLLDRGADINLAYGPTETTVVIGALGSGRFSQALELVESGYRYDLDRVERATNLYIASYEEQPAKDRLLELLAELK